MTYIYIHAAAGARRGTVRTAYLRNKNVRPLLQIAVALRIVLEIVVCPLNQGDTCVVDFEAAHEGLGIHECGSLN